MTYSEFRKEYNEKYAFVSKIAADIRSPKMETIADLPTMEDMLKREKYDEWLATEATIHIEHLKKALNQYTEENNLEPIEWNRVNYNKPQTVDEIEKKYGIEIFEKAWEAVKDKEIEITKTPMTVGGKTYSEIAKERFSDPEDQKKIERYIDEFLVVDDKGGYLDHIYNNVYDITSNQITHLTSVKEYFDGEPSAVNYLNAVKESNGKINLGENDNFVRAMTLSNGDYNKKVVDAMAEYADHVYDIPIDAKRQADYIKILDLMEKNGVFSGMVAGKGSEEGSKVYGMWQYSDALNKLGEQIQTGTLEDIEKAGKSVHAEKQKMLDLYKEIDKFLDIEDFQIPPNVASARNSKINYDLRAPIKVNSIVNGAYVLVSSCQELGIDYHEVVKNPKLYRDAIVNNEAMNNYKPHIENNNKAQALVNFSIGDPGFYNKDVVFERSTLNYSTIRGFEALKYIYEDRVKASNIVGVYSAYFPQHLTGLLNCDGKANKVDVFEKLLLADKIENATQLREFGDVDCVSFKQINPPIPTVEEALKEHPEKYGKYILDESNNLLADYVDILTKDPNLATNMKTSPSFISSADIVKGTIDLASKSLARLQAMGDPAYKNDIKALKSYLKDPIEATKSVLSELENEKGAKVNDSVETIARGFALNSKANEIKNFKNEVMARDKALYASKAKSMKAVTKDEKSCMKENAKFNKAMDKLQANKGKLETKRNEAKNDKAKEKATKAIGSANEKITKLKAKALATLEKEFQNGKIPETYLNERANQIVNGDTTKIADFGKEKDNFIQGRIENNHKPVHHTQLPKEYNSILKAPKATRQPIHLKEAEPKPTHKSVDPKQVNAPEKTIEAPTQNSPSK